ncbi:hypothetical protein Airi02_013100 [Actinoallomurus iriomotensis]|uniref:Secreted protein n=1 Tax=Actinoallomurus iriomotensis TaxID=478107 RepID=A0A9W6S0W4_9ACTN|nr:hypothetical protein Airi02_013100 [Actinoallomurus iriomotensis]
MRFKPMALAGAVLASTTTALATPAFAASQTAPRAVTQVVTGSGYDVRPRPRVDTTVIFPGAAPRDTGPDLPCGWLLIYSDVSDVPGVTGPGTSCPLTL